jgi:hypothetical protein
MQGQLAGTEKQCFSKKRSAHGQESARQYLFQANDFSAMFNRNSTTPEIIKQAAERKKIQPGRSVLRIVSELSANRKLSSFHGGISPLKSPCRK